ncbi:hypothetical protein GTA26_27855 [Rhodococcus hoagii]|nr:hypothetical protein [Prescottella equi]
MCSKPRKEPAIALAVDESGSDDDAALGADHPVGCRSGGTEHGDRIRLAGVLDDVPKRTRSVDADGAEGDDDIDRPASAAASRFRVPS